MSLVIIDTKIESTDSKTICICIRSQIKKIECVKMLNPYSVRNHRTFDNASC